MKKILLLFIALLIYSCNSATENDEPKTKLIGAVTFRIIRINEIGQMLGRFLQKTGIDGVKVELLSDSRVVATTYTRESDSLDCFFVFDNVDSGVEYRIKASLDDNIFSITDPFTIAENETGEQNKDSIRKILGFAPEWFKSGIYYMDILKNYQNNLVIDAYNEDIHFFAFPQPLSNKGTIFFEMPETDECKMEILNHRFESVRIIFRGILESGNHTFSFDAADIDEGFYLMHYSYGENNKYFPMSVKRN